MFLGNVDVTDPRSTRTFTTKEYNELQENNHWPAVLAMRDFRTGTTKAFNKVASKAVEAIPVRLQELVLMTRTLETTNSNSSNSSSSPFLTRVVKMDLDLVLVLTATTEWLED